MRNFKKIRLFASLLCVGLSFTGCSDNNESGHTQLTDEEGMLGMGYYAPSLQTPFDIHSRAPGDLTDKEKSENGTPNEDKVNTIRLVYYNVETGIAEYAFDYEYIHTAGTNDFAGSSMRPTGDYDPVGSGYFTPLAEKVAIRDYELLVLINPCQEIKDITKGRRDYYGALPIIGNHKNSFYDAIKKINNNDLTDLIGAPNSASVDPNNKPENFLMTNYQELVYIPAAQIKPTEEEAYAASEKKANRVFVDRAVAKVTVVPVAAEVPAIKAKVSNLFWRLDVTNKSTFWTRHMDKMKSGVFPEEDVVPEKPLNVNYRHYLYAKDPNFDGVSQERTPVGSVSHPNTEFRRLSALSDVSIPVGDTHFEYAPENTMEADEQQEDVTTAVILKLDYRPTHSALGTEVKTTDRYFVWAGYVLTAEDLVKIRDYDSDPQNVTWYDTFYTLQEHLKAKAGILENTIIGFGTDYKTPQNASYQVEGISYYYTDTNYYRIMIRHYSDLLESRAMRYGRFGLVRNNVYKLTIRTVNAPGTIDIPEPQGPDDKLQRLAVEIEVLPWVVREQAVDVGNPY
ncbi:hypothetical protein D0T51_07645 [Parabacteroides sp. 52]|uniref:Mfa1 family fimbria major subunit n=1 Tax=unclassified Parabacteroides TaxID=2649774 RepID=UPI0013D1BD9F|nr:MULTISPECIES: Mfa1 family fimbria major subunit [unclassified Parabacteroides]MDH6534883.1 hypothetical protein [Parabacteroides sp. PM5-20]NDV55600.1 hypothetical protein [Parabacteroides sp. 52]